MWKYLNYEVCGRSHLKAEIPCQDKTISGQERGVYVIALADGAGSASHSQEGAEVVVSASKEFVTHHFDELIEQSDGRQVKMALLHYLIEKLEERAQSLGCNLDDLASTFLMVAIKDNRFLVSHIGDGVIGYLKGDALKVASLPENGEFANSTVFVTSKNALSYMKLFKGTLDEISGFVLMSDGTAESFYSKKEVKLAPILTKIMHKNALLDEHVMKQSIKESFDQIIVNNTQDDCSIALISRLNGVLGCYEALTEYEKCELLGIRYGSSTFQKQLSRYDKLLEILHRPREVSQVSRQLFLRNKYTKRHLERLVRIGIVSKVNVHYSRVGY